VGEACVGRPLRSVRKSRTLGATLELFRGGMAVADIARVRGLGSETILVHLADLTMAGESLDLSRVVGKERAEVILEAARNSAPMLGAIKRALPPDFTFGEIRLVLASNRLLPTATRNPVPLEPRSSETRTADPG
jgi:uncharacterized protein YpbB